MTDHTVRVDGADIHYRDEGSGPVVVFVHGVYVTGAVWSETVAALAGHARCIVPTWPLGAHDALGDNVDLDVAVTARRIVGLLEALDLRDVTLVANDSGGGLVLTALGDPAVDFERVAGLVLTNCDSYEHFPPGSFAKIVSLCRVSSRLGGAILAGLGSGLGQRFFLKAVAKHPVDDARRAEIFGAFATSRASRREGVRVTASLDPALTLAASEAIEAYDRPVRIVWGTEDDLFPLAHAERLHAAFPRSTLVEVPGAAAFVMLDDPQTLATEIREALPG
ncbi:MAG: Alpha/beta hydrolase [Aeromicrobium sp.]|nr:Alpha/beta hydrolase [Aeromicrobium sp.]